MNVQEIPPELWCNIFEKLGSANSNIQQVSSYFNACSKKIEKDTNVFFDGSKSSISNIFTRGDSISKIHLDQRNLDFFKLIFGVDHGFKLHIYKD